MDDDPCPACHHPHVDYTDEPCVSCGCDLSYIRKHLAENPEVEKALRAILPAGDEPINPFKDGSPRWQGFVRGVNAMRSHGA